MVERALCRARGATQGDMEVCRARGHTHSPTHPPMHMTHLRRGGCGGRHSLSRITLRLPTQQPSLRQRHRDAVWAGAPTCAVCRVATLRAQSGTPDPEHRRGDPNPSRVLPSSSSTGSPHIACMGPLHSSHLWFTGYTTSLHWMQHWLPSWFEASLGAGASWFSSCGIALRLAG